MYTLEQLEKDHLNYNYSLFIKRVMFIQYTNLLYLLLLISRYRHKISKPVSIETFVEASKVVDKPLNVIKWHSFML